jgi:threonine synthase
MYFDNAFPPEFEVIPDTNLANKPELVITPKEKEKLSETEYTATTANRVVAMLGLEKK